MDLAASKVRPDETLREATLADRQCVLDLDTNVYGGLDYLPYVYDDIICNSNNKCYIYEKQGRMVGFLRTRLLDGGQTLLTEAGRLAHDIRGDGMYTRFKRRVFEEWRGSPNLQHIAMAVTLDDSTNKKERILKNYTEVLEKHVSALKLDLATLRKRLRSRELSNADHSRLQLLSCADVTTMMRQGPDQLRHLFPEQRVFLFWVPLQIVEANAETMFDGHRKTIATMKSPIQNSKEASGDVFPVTFMSSAISYPCKRGRAYHLDLFGAGSDADLRQHVDWHARQLAAEAGEEETAVFQIYHTRHVQVDVIVDELQRKCPAQLLSDHPIKSSLALMTRFVK